MNSLLGVFTILFSIAPPLLCNGGRQSADWYQDIPGEQRDQLKQAMMELVEAEKTGNWKRVYALLDKKLTETEAKFVSKMEQAHQLREFRPSKVTFVPPDRSWNIQGCASFEGDQTGKAMVASVHARWGDSRWHLSPIVIDLFGSEKKMAPRQCLLAEERPVSTIHAAPTRTATRRNTHK